MNDAKPKKMVGRSVAIALGIGCILLIAGLGGAIVYYTMTINDKNDKIDSINAQLATIIGNNTNINATEIINQLNTNITNLTSENNQLQAWLDGNETLLNQTETWFDDNITYYNSQISSLNSQIANLQNQKNQLQTWLNGNITSYTSQINSLNSQITNLQNQVSSLNSQITTKDNTISQLNSQITNLQNQVSSLNAQIISLQSQIANLQAPNLIKVNLKSDDNHPIFQQEYLHVYGEICNVGFNTAYNCELHVVGYQSGGVVAFDTYILLGTISGYSWTPVDGSIPYNGGALTSWTITPQWTS